MSEAERLAVIKSQALALIEQITASPKPTYMIGGQMVSWGAYLRQLQDTISWCDAQLSAQSPVEIRSQAIT